MSNFNQKFLPQLQNALKIQDPFRLRNWVSQEHYFDMLKTSVLLTLNQLTREEIKAGGEFEELRLLLDRILLRRYLLSSRFEYFENFTVQNDIEVPSPLGEIIENWNGEDASYKRQIQLIETLATLECDDEPFKSLKADIQVRFINYQPFVNVATTVEVEAAVDSDADSDFDVGSLVRDAITFVVRDEGRVRNTDDIFLSAQTIDSRFRRAVEEIQDAMRLSDDFGRYWYRLGLLQEMVRSADISLDGRSAAAAIGWLIFLIENQIPFPQMYLLSIWGVYHPQSRQFRPVDGLKAKLDACLEDGIRVIAIPESTLEKTIKPGTTLKDYASQQQISLIPFPDAMPVDKVYDFILAECQEERKAADLIDGDNLKLSILGRYLSDTDNITTNILDSPPGSDWIFQGQMFYVPSESDSDNRNELSRFDIDIPGIKDHMDSWRKVPPDGYDFEGTLGYPFKTEVFGSGKIVRWYNPVSLDHLTSFETPRPGGYDWDWDLGYGYPRYGMSEPQIGVSGEEVKLVANKAAGGAICGLWWNGKQFVNNYDYGRRIQIAFILDHPVPTGKTLSNLTEAGDNYGYRPERPSPRELDWAHGSPLLYASTVGNTLTTVCHPLQFIPEGFGGDADHPVMWTGTITKEVQLDCDNIPPDIRPHVIRWTTEVNFPIDRNYLDMEVVTAFLTHDFTRFYVYNAENNERIEISNVPNKGCLDMGKDPRLDPAAGGVIIATQGGDYALGVYHRDANNNYGFGFCQDLGSGHTGGYGFDYTKWSLLYRPGGGISAGVYSCTAYLIIGKLEDVTTEMQILHEYLAPTVHADSKATI